MSIIQKGILNGNNQRHKVPEQFMQLRQKQVENKAAVRLLFLNDLQHLLPEELWLMFFIGSRFRVTWGHMKSNERIVNKNLALRAKNFPLGS